MSGTGHLEPAPAPSPGALRSAERVQALIGTQLADVRKAADSWRTGLLGLLALIATVSVVKGRESFQDLAFPGPEVIGLALAAALALAAYGSLQAMKAAYGDPKARKTDGILTWDYQDSEAAVGSLRNARWAIVLSLLALAVSVALTWYWPTEAATRVRADFGSTKVCGTLVRADSQTVVIKEDGSEKSNPTTGLLSLATVDKCS